MILMTGFQVKRIKKINEIKEKYGYKWAPNDLKLKSTGKIIKTALTSSLAGVLCGIAGLAPGLVLGPLFLSYNMFPQVMSGTN